MALREHGRDSIGRFDFDGGEVEADDQELLDPNSNVVLQNGNKKPYGFGLAHCSLPNELGQPALEIAERLLIGAEKFSCTSGMPFIDESSVIYFGGAGRLRDGVYLYFLGHSAHVSSIARILTFFFIPIYKVLNWMIQTVSLTPHLSTLFVTNQFFRINSLPSHENPTKK